MRRAILFVTPLLLIAHDVCAQGQVKVDQIRTFNGSPGTRSFEFHRAGTLAPAVGVDLLGVELELALTVSGGSLLVDNDGPEGGFVDVYYLASATTSSDDIPLGALIARAINQDTLFLGPDDEHPGGPPSFTLDDGPDIGQLFPFEGFEASDDVLFEQAPILDIFRGEEGFGIDVTVDTDFGISGMPSVAGSFTGISVENVTLRLSYFYTPAPGALALLGVGAVMRRRRR